MSAHIIERSDGAPKPHRFRFGRNLRSAACPHRPAVGGPDSCAGLVLDRLLRRPGRSPVLWHLDAGMVLYRRDPLPFGSLPYRGGRYTIASMYDSSTTSITSAARSPAGSGTTRGGDCSSLCSSWGLL